MSARRRQQERQGLAMCLIAALALGLSLWGAYEADKARGMTVGESLASAGL